MGLVAVASQFSNSSSQNINSLMQLLMANPVFEDEVDLRINHQKSHNRNMRNYMLFVTG